MKKAKTFLTAFTCVILAASAAPAMAARSRIPSSVTIVNERNKSISRQTVAAGDRFELKARVDAGAEDDYLEWKILSGKNVVRFVDYEKYGDEAELTALKAGTAKVQVYVNGNSGKKIKDTITITVKKDSSPAGGTIFAKESTTKYEEVFDDFDLEIIKSKPSIPENHLKWSIANPAIVGFANGRKTGHEVDFYAKKTGTTKITCNYMVNGKAKSSVTFTVRVIWDD